MPAKSFDEAIEAVRQYALERFNAASAEITRLSKLPTPSAPEEKRQHAADLVKAQNEMAASLQQLGQVEDMISEKRGRAGYDAVVKLMEETQLTATHVYNKLKGLTGVPDSSTAEYITLLTNVLLALARLSPAPVWQKDPTPEGTAG